MTNAPPRSSPRCVGCSRRLAFGSAALPTPSQFSIWRGTDSRLGDAVRPTFLTFAGEVEPGEPFAHMIENRILVDALTAKSRELGIDLRSAAVTDFTLGAAVDDNVSPDRRRIDVRLSDAN